MATLATLAGFYSNYRQSKIRPKSAPAIPVPDDEEIKRARRKTGAQQSSGRAATILTDTGGLGG